MRKILFIILIICIKQLSAQVCFTSTNFPVGVDSTIIACADFNSDGKLDLVVASYNINGLYMLIGDGQGSFGVANIAYAPGFGLPPSYESCMISSDFNNDGKADLAYGNPGSVKVLYGDGSGGFPTTNSFVVSSSPSSICSADFNGDGKTDLATANSGNPGIISILLGDGAGNFSTHADFFAGSLGLWAITSGDFNGDSKVDIATSNYDSLWVLLGNGSGSFGTAIEYKAGAELISICSKDFNADGFADIAVSNTNSNDVSVLLSKGASGLFNPAISYPAGSMPWSVISADFNSDGKSDLAIADVGNNSVSVMLGSGTGSFSAAYTFTTDSNPWAILSADFNGDGKPDLATANENSSKISVLLNVVTPACTGCGILNYSPAVPNICMVTTDSVSNYNYNMITWDKTPYNNVDSFIVYRKDAITSNYLRIGSVSKNSLSEFTDTALSVGGPNGGNPKYSSWLYKLAIRDTCGNIGTQSPYHQSMFVQKSGSNFSWNAYAVESGQTNPITGYSFLRDDNNTGNWHVLVNTTGLSSTDPNYANYPNGNWRIDAFGFNCTPIRTQNTYLKSHSNTTNQAVTGINQLASKNEQITIYPNPSSGKFTVKCSEKISSIEIKNLLGEKVYSSNLPIGQSTIDISDKEPGIYFLTIQSTTSSTTKKLILE